MVSQGMTRWNFALSQQEAGEIETLAKRESRTLSNMCRVLVLEALRARHKAETVGQQVERAKAQYGATLRTRAPR